MPPFISFFSSSRIGYWIFFILILWTFLISTQTLQTSNFFSSPAQGQSLLTSLLSATSPLKISHEINACYLSAEGSGWKNSSFPTVWIQDAVSWIMSLKCSGSPNHGTVFGERTYMSSKALSRVKQWWTQSTKKTGSLIRQKRDENSLCVIWGQWGGSHLQVRSSHQKSDLYLGLLASRTVSVYTYTCMVHTAISGSPLHTHRDT